MCSTSRKSGKWRGAASASRPKKCWPTPPNAFLRLLSELLSWCRSRMLTGDERNSQMSRRWFCRSNNFIFLFIYFIFRLLATDCTNWAPNMAHWSSFTHGTSSQRALRSFCPPKMCRRRRSVCARRPIPQQWAMGRGWSDADVRNRAGPDRANVSRTMWNVKANATPTVHRAITKLNDHWSEYLIFHCWSFYSKILR